MLSLIPQLLYLLVLLTINGEPLRALVFRRFRFFKDLNIIQICVLNVYLGGMILYVLAMIPLGIFNWYTVTGITLANFLAIIIVHFRILKQLNVVRIKEHFNLRRKETAEYLLVALMFLAFLTINLIAASSSVLGSVRDESIHSLAVQVLLENNQVPLTMQPYLAEGIIYPQGAHVIFAFAVHMLAMDVPKTVFYVTILFKAISVLGAYFLGRSLNPSKNYGLVFSFVFALISSWPLSVVWGGNPFLVGFPLFLICLGLLFSTRYFRVL
ncbi:hypothetical protein KEJ15_08690, partial [Candidatus Bathyarchaeota archaeon]|nr:hypothetical protein [Candidatus Bathyarchaeota archaeon]